VELQFLNTIFKKYREWCSDDVKTWKTNSLLVPWEIRSVKNVT